MNTIGNIRLTPEKIVEYGISFGIPIYQRLFAWNKKQVLRLMEDLYEHYMLNDRINKPYYIGALSCVRHGDRYDLIDGQQRMTVISLIGIAFNSVGPVQAPWRKFHADGERLHFVARSSDSSYFQGRVLGESYCKDPNQLMEEGIKTIEDFIQNRLKQDEISDFSQWIFKNLSIFISVLPKSYEGNKNLLNKYFENMNTGGKGLEQHDILKVRLITGQSNQKDLIRIWNTACDFSQNAIKIGKDENDAEYSQKYSRAIAFCRQGNYSAAIDMCIGSYEEDDATTIGEIVPIPYEKEESNDDFGRQTSLIGIDEFLLMVLDLQGYNGKVQNKESFYDQQLLKAFSPEVVSALDIQKFYKDILLYRLLLDYYFISLEREDWGMNYDLILYSKEKEKIARCRQFEAMLYVSDTPMYHWITPLMFKLKHEDFDSDRLLKELKVLDRQFRGQVEYIHLLFPEVKVYWFRKLEYLIWENRKELFKGDDHSLAVADDYKFVSNRRSREHIIPQTPKSESNLRWLDTDEDTEIRNSFGNLVLISSSLNSKLSNESYEIKKAYVQSYQKRSMGGAIESLSLLLFHTRYPDVNKDNMREIIREYGNFTFNEILKPSFS